MEIRVLEYFLAVAREQNISRAAEFLHLTQPTLSRQLIDLEKELGKQLMIRGNRKITLTEDGMLLRKRAEEIINLVHKTESEVKQSGDVISGNIFIGAGETEGVRYIAKIAKKIKDLYPDVQFHIVSGDAIDICEKLDKGLLDFAVLLGKTDASKYNCFTLPFKDKWGILMKKDSELASKRAITPQDLYDKPLIVSRQASRFNELSDWMQTNISQLNIAATYNLIYNASLMVDEGLGYAFDLDNLINTTGNSNLCFVPLSPSLTLDVSIVWKKYQVFNKASELFIKMLKKEFSKT